MEEKVFFSKLMEGFKQENNIFLFTFESYSGSVVWSLEQADELQGFGRHPRERW